MPITFIKFMKNEDVSNAITDKFVVNDDCDSLISRKK